MNISSPATSRWLAVSLVLVVMICTACGSTAPSSMAPASAVPVASPTAAPVAPLPNEPVAAGPWELASAAAPYKGTTIKAVFLDRPGYAAAIKLLPEFEQLTGIKVEYDILPYEDTYAKEVLDFTGKIGAYDVVLIDVVWIGEFASRGWVVPLEKFSNDPKLADPNLNLKGFFPILLGSLGTWDTNVYALPFDNYAGLLFYNKCMLKEAGFDGPPKTWEELYETYGPALTKGDKYAYALQSSRNETQSADSFLRMVWQANGSLLKSDSFAPNLSSPESLAGLKFRQDLMKYMPPDIATWDHAQAVQGLAQGEIAMITEWSAFYKTLADPATSKISDCLAVTVEPAGADGKPHPALGGFSLGVNANSTPEKQAAAWLFIQWVTSEAKAKDYIKAGGVSARQSAYDDPELQKQFPYFAPLVESWRDYGNPVFRPRFPEWPKISDVIAQIGNDMMVGSVSVEDGVKTIEDQLRLILQDYTSGKKPKLQ